MIWHAYVKRQGALFISSWLVTVAVLHTSRAVAGMMELTFTAVAVEKLALIFGRWRKPDDSCTLLVCVGDQKELNLWLIIFLWKGRRQLR